MGRVMTDDLFDPTDRLFAPELITAGRYRLPNRDGSHHPGGWMRATNLASALSDQRALQDWMIQMTLLGVRARHDLVDELSVMDVDSMEPATLRKELLRIAEQARSYAKGDAGMRRGNARHDMVGRFHATGEEVGTPAMRAQLASYRAILDAHGLAPVDGMQERVVIVEEVNAAGRFDTVLQDVRGGPPRIGDLKTQRAFWSLMEVRAQLAIYAHADAIWDEATGAYIDPPPFDRDLGHVMWMPKDRPEEWPEDHEHDVQLLDIDLVKGWRTALCAFQIVQDRSEAKSAAALRSMFRPLPVDAAVVMRTVETYAGLLGSAGTLAEVRRLVAEVRDAGLWCPELEMAATKTAVRIRAGS
jgi:hypothetical protein